MSKLSVKNNIGSKSSQRTFKTKGSLASKRSRYSGSLVSEHGSRFGRSVNRFPKPNDPGLTQTLSTENSRFVATVFNPSLSPGSKLPDLRETAATDSIRELGKCLNILDYEFNYASFWLLDVLSNYVRDLQLNNFSVTHQETFLSWFRFVLRCVSITGSSREEIFTLLQEMFKSAVATIEETTSIPLPEDIDLGGSAEIISPTLSADWKSAELIKSSIESTTSRKGRKRTSSQRKSSKNSGKSRKSVSRKSSVVVIDDLNGDREDVKKQCMQVFHTIIDILYQIFAERFAFTMTSLAYSSPNRITLVDLTVGFNDPKPLKTEPDPLPLPAPTVHSPKSAIKGRDKSKEKGKKTKLKSIEEDQGSKVKTVSGKKKGNKSRESSKPPTDIDTGTGNEKENKKDSKRKSRKDIALSKKGKEKSVKKDFSTDVEEERTEEIKDDQIKAVKPKGGKRKKSRENFDEKSTSDGKVGKKNKSKGGKEKGKPKKEKKDVEDKMEKLTKSKGKSEPKSAKSGKRKRKATLNSKEDKNNQMDDRESALQNLRERFNRTVCPGMEEETGINKFILPLSDAIDKNYVEKLIRSLLPPEVKQEIEPNLFSDKNEKHPEKSRSFENTSAKSLKKKAKSKKQ